MCKCSASARVLSCTVCVVMSRDVGAAAAIKPTDSRRAVCLLDYAGIQKGYIQPSTHYTCMIVDVNNNVCVTYLM